MVDYGKYKSQFSMNFSRLNQFIKREFKSRANIPSYFYPTAPFFIRHLLWRKKLNMATIILIVGSIRSGKSYLGLKLCEIYSKWAKLPAFDVKKQFSFDVLPFLRWSKTATDSIYGLDEIGVNLPPREWYSIQSKIFSNFTQTQGFRRNVLIMMLPNAKFLLSSIRIMCNYIIIMRTQGRGFILKQKIDHIKGKPYYMSLGLIKSSLPNKKNIEIYEKIKKDWNNKRLEDDIKELENVENNKYVPKYKEKAKLDMRIAANVSNSNM